MPIVLVYVNYRQSGKSTTVTAYILWLILFKDSQNIAILANKGSLARDLLGKIQFAYEYLPKWLQQGIVVWNKGNIELENSSKVCRRHFIVSYSWWFIQSYILRRVCFCW